MSVFISYSHKDNALADEVEKVITSAGLPHWRDTQLKGGFEWVPSIDKAIKRCFVLVVIVTSASMESMYVTYEWSYAMGLGKTVIPLVFELDGIHPKIKENIQCIYFKDNAEFWKDLISAIETAEKQEIEPEEIKQASQSLEEMDTTKWQGAVTRLLHHPHPKATPALLRAVKSGDLLVSTLASIAYAEKTNYEDDQVVEYLKAIFTNRNIQGIYKYEEKAVTALAKIQTDECIQFIGSILLNEKTYPLLRKHILSSVYSEVQNPLIKPFLRDFIKQKIYMHHEELSTAISSLAKFRDEEDIELFRRYSDLNYRQENLGIMITAVNSIAEIPSEKSTLALLEMLTHYAQNGASPVTNLVIKLLVEKGKYEEVIEISKTRSASGQTNVYMKTEALKFKSGG